MSLFLSRGLAALSFALAAGVAGAAQIQLYETGPAEDASFVRFVNSGAEPMAVSAKGSQARIQLDAAHPASDFMPVKAGAKMQGLLESGGRKQEVDISVQPGEFASVVGLPGKDGLQARIVREQPEDFNALKVSVGFYNLDPSCADAGLLAVPRNLAMFEHVADGAVARRLVNPVSLKVRASCGGQPAGQELDLGALQAGERHTVFLLPSAQGSRLLHAADQTAR